MGLGVRGEGKSERREVGTVRRGEGRGEDRWAGRVEEAGAGRRRVQETSGRQSEEVCRGAEWCKQTVTVQEPKLQGRLVCHLGFLPVCLIY